MSDGDASLSQALSQLSEAADIVGNDEVEEVARVRKARASISEHARQSGDNAGNLLSSLIGQSNAEIEEEKNKIERAAREKEAQEKAKQERDAEKKRQEAEARLEEEKRKIEEKEQRRLQMLADLEKKRKREAGIVDEEEEEAKRAAEAEAAAREAAQKAREEAEAAALKNANDELAAKIEASKKEKQQREAAAALAAKKRKTTTGILAATFIGILAAVAIVIALSIKGPDYYAFDSKNKTFPVAIDRMQGSHLDTKEIAIAEVVQEAPRVATKSNKGSKAKTDVYGIGPAKNVLSGSSIVK